MKQYALDLFQSMQKDITICRQKGFDEEKEIECCYQVCNKYWRQLSQLCAVHHFKNEEEEIDFFKNIKPLFTSEIEYYNLRYHAQLFRPLIGADELEKFWLRESLRLQRFMENNREFYRYYSKQQTCNDCFYFLRKNNELTEFPEANISQQERITSTSHDHLVAEYLALDQYNNYVQQEIEKLKEAKLNSANHKKQ